MKIDFVLPWVDPLDEKWQVQKESFSKDIKLGRSNSKARYRDMQTLKYALRSIELHCPWYNKIFLITQGHYPDWLDINHDKIQLITHEQLYKDKTHLPTFNSSSIEMNLANINNLSEYFVYLNDDCFIMRDTKQSRFFQDNLPVDFLANGIIPRNKIYETIKKDTLDAWYFSIKNNLKLSNEKIGVKYLKTQHLYHKSYPLKVKISNFLMKHFYKKALWISHWHYCQPYTKTTLKEVSNAFMTQMQQCSKNKFRTKNDLTQYLYRYWHLLHGRFYPYRHQDELKDMSITSLDSLKHILKQIHENKNIRFACLNDVPSLSENEFLLAKDLLIKSLDKYFPNKASFEK